MHVHVNDIDLWYEVQGIGPPVILLHGNGEDHRIFDILIGKLSASRTVYALDSRCHGRSGHSREISYAMMAEDVAAFIRALGLQKPALYGFSDGGIIGLLVASTHPDLLSSLIVSGANTHPAGVKAGWRHLFTVLHFFSRSKLMELMLKEPDIHADDLLKISVPLLVLAGEKDIVKESDTRYIVLHVPGAILKILLGENHQSYVVHSPKLYDAIREFWQLPHTTGSRPDAI